MAGLLDGKQLKDGSVTPNKLAEQYIPVHEGGEGDKFLSDDGTYKEIPVVELPAIALSDKVLTCDAAGLKANITLVTDGNQVRIEGKIGENGEPVLIGEFNVLQSQIIEKAEVINDHLFITFLVDGDPGTETVNIDLSRFIDVYEGSEYVDVNGNIITLDYETLHDKLLNDSFIKITGLADYYTKNDVDDLIAGIESVPHADTADRLTTARTINGVAFDGSKDITFHSLYPERIPVNADLNDYTQPGMYYCDLNDTARTLLNCPVDLAFSLLVERHAGVKQTLTTYNGNAYTLKGDGVIYIRNEYKTVWKEWYEVFTEFSANIRLKDTHETYINLNLTDKITNKDSYTRRVLLLHRLDVDDYPTSLEGHHSVQGTFSLRRYGPNEGPVTADITVVSCVGWGSAWRDNPSMSIISMDSSYWFNNYYIIDPFCGFCEVSYEGILYRAIYMNGNQYIQDLTFSGKIYNPDNNFGKLIAYEQFYDGQKLIENVLNDEIYNSITITDDHLNPAQHINVGSSSIYGNLNVGRKYSEGDGRSGVIISRNGGIDMCNAISPYINFHYGNSKQSYTSRIYESSPGVLTLEGDVNITGDLIINGKKINLDQL